VLAETIVAPMKEWGWDAVCDDGEGVDILPLIDQGVPGLLLRLDERWWSNEYFHVHHTEADTIDKIDAHKLLENTQQMAMMAWLLAEVEETLPRGKPRS
jgi:carboxypeptidase Q